MGLAEVAPRRARFEALAIRTGSERRDRKVGLGEAKAAVKEVKGLVSKSKMEGRDA